MPRVVVLILALFALTALLTRSTQAQTYSKIYDFTGGPDGSSPYAGLTIDKAGNLYGTAQQGGSYGGNCGTNGCGTVFKLRRRNGAWTLIPLYAFQGGTDGVTPYGALTIGADGSLFGTTYQGGVQPGSGYGTVFNLRPPASACATLCPWTETVLYRFGGGNDGSLPRSNVVFDQQGNLYGTTYAGGQNDLGTVYKLTRANGSWTETLLYSFTGLGDGTMPAAGVIFDRSGNLYGTTSGGLGTVYELTPSGSGWVENTLYAFHNGGDGGYPWGGLIFDQSGNLYGATTTGGSGMGGTAYKLTFSNGGWTFATLYSFSMYLFGGPYDSLTIDGVGNLYGTTEIDGAYTAGSAFELVDTRGTWSEVILHNFYGTAFGSTDGSNPTGSVIFDENGDLYGTTSGGGVYNAGTIFDIMP